jgi:hypothetical protein
MVLFRSGVSDMTTSTDAKPAAKRPRKMAHQPIAEPEQPTRARAADTAPANAPPAAATTKTAVVLELLRRNEGVTLDQLVSATGWLPHTTRAALTGLKKKGHQLTSDKVDGVRRYRIAALAPNAGAAQ